MDIAVRLATSPAVAAKSRPPGKRTRAQFRHVLSLMYSWPSVISGQRLKGAELVGG